MMFGIGVRNDGSNHILEVDLVVMFVKSVIMMIVMVVVMVIVVVLH